MALPIMVKGRPLCRGCGYLMSCISNTRECELKYEAHVEWRSNSESGDFNTDTEYSVDSS